MDRQDALKQLESMLAGGTVPARDLNFVTSLVGQSKTRGLSPGQWHWVVQLATQFTAPPRAQTQITGFARVYEMFKRARLNLKFPKVRLNVNDEDLKLYVSGERSSMPGVVNVTSGDGEMWYGRIFEDGSWEHSGRADPAKLPAVEEGLRQFAADPEGVAAAHGRLTGNCCFCSSPLKDERSITVGYGPVCAKRFSLRWGNRSA